ncbi:MAG: dockerin type I repeat-containing protein [Planctomycetota bacterium]
MRHSWVQGQVRWALGMVLATWVVGGTAIAQDPNLTLRVQSTSIAMGSSGTVAVTFDNTGASDVDGWSYGVCHNLAFVDILSAVQGSTTLTSNGGMMPGFQSLTVLPGEGYTVGVVIDLFGIFKLAPGLGYELSVGTYQALGTLGDTTNICICGTLGVPAVADVVVVGGASIIPTEVCGTVSITGSNPFIYTASDETVEFDGVTGVAAGDTVISVSIADPNTIARDTQGFSMALRHDPAYLTPLGSQIMNGLAAMNMGAGPDFFVQNFNPANGPGFTVGVAYSLMGGVFLQFPMAGEVVFELTYDVDATILAAPVEPGNPFTTDLTWDPALGSPPVENVVVVAGAAEPPSLFNGSVFLSPVYGVPLIRGDCNDDGIVNIADTIWIIAQLFDNGPVSTCTAACDPNGDGGLDTSDAIYDFNYLFLMGPPPVAPFPDCDLVTGEDCDLYNSCP